VFDSAREFTEGVAVVEINGKWGYINKQGKFSIAPDFYNGWRFTNGLAQVVLEPNRQLEGGFIEDIGHKWAYIDKTSKES
jgi:hypothetical protein